MQGAEGILLVKLGGSLITDKSRPRTVREELLASIAAQLARARTARTGRLLIGHGSGSFGHRAAARFAVHEGIDGEEDLEGVTATQGAAAELHVRVLDALREEGVPTFSVAPSSAIVTSARRPHTVAVDALEQALAAGLVPVTYGDVVMDRTQGAAVCSTETALLAFAGGLLQRGGVVRGAWWFGDTPGVLDAGGETMPVIRRSELSELRDRVGGAAATDVTGGMRHRLEAVAELADLGVTSWILDGRPAGAVQEALLEEPEHGTRIDP